MVCFRDTQDSRIGGFHHGGALALREPRKGWKSFSIILIFWTPTSGICEYTFRPLVSQRHMYQCGRYLCLSSQRVPAVRWSRCSGPVSILLKNATRQVKILWEKIELNFVIVARGCTDFAINLIHPSLYCFCEERNRVLEGGLFHLQRQELVSLR